MNNRLKSYVSAIAIAAAMVVGAPNIGAAQTMVDYANLVEQLSPAVVNIATTTKARRISAGEAFGPFGPEGNPFAGTPFEEFFNNFNQGLSRGFGDVMTRPQQSLGTGVLISTDGYVVTNNHVVENADEIVVKLSNNRHDFPARVIGRDEKTDLALLKINATTKLPAVTLGDSAKVRVGEGTLAIGNPFGLGGTVTSGIVSALGRNIGQGPYDDFIQTDAAINPGNSGGPLFNARGEVIGINSAIFTRSGGSNGIGFAIPANTVKQVVAQLKQYGHTKRAMLGVKIQPLTSSLAESLGLKDDAGALVAEVSAGTPAARAGLRSGDVITSFNGQPIVDANDLPKRVAATPIGTKVSVGFIRNGKAMQAQATVAEQTGESITPSTPSEDDQADTAEMETNHVGLAVQQLDPQTRAQLNIPSEIKGGLLVVSAQRGGSAAEAGLQRGDVITEAEWRPVRDITSLRRALSGKRGSTLLLRVWRNEGYFFVSLKVPKS
jgi:serine protease Do